MIAPARPDDDAPAEAGTASLVDDFGRPVDLESVAIVCWHRGMKNREIAARLGVKESTVSRWLKRALEQGRLDPLPHPREFGTRTECRCIWSPIRPGEPLVCVSCCESGYDFHEAMKAEPLPCDRKAYRPTALKGGSGDAPADEAAGQEATAEAIEERPGKYAHRYVRRRRGSGR